MPESFTQVGVRDAVPACLTLPSNLTLRDLAVTLRSTSSCPTDSYTDVSHVLDTVANMSASLAEPLPHSHPTFPLSHLHICITPCPQYAVLFLTTSLPFSSLVQTSAAHLSRTLSEQKVRNHAVPYRVIPHRTVQRSPSDSSAPLMSLCMALVLMHSPFNFAHYACLPYIPLSRPVLP